MNRTSKVIVVLVLILVVLFGIGQFFAFSTPNNATNPTAPTQQTITPTQITIFTAELPASGTVPTENGSCFTDSIAAPYRADAWRCTVGNAISDPCFQIASSTSLLCGVNPAEGSFATTTFLLHLTKALPKATLPPGSAPSNWAWAVQLADGTYCTPFTGTRPVAQDGVFGTYACASPNSSENMILGDLNTSSTEWMATVGSLNAGTSSSLPTVGYSIEIPVTSVWQ